MGDWPFRAKIVQFVQLDMMNGLENEKSLTCLKINDLRDKQRTLNNYASMWKESQTNIGIVYMNL